MYVLCKPGCATCCVVLSILGIVFLVRGRHLLFFSWGKTRAAHDSSRKGKKNGEKRTTWTRDHAARESERGKERETSEERERGSKGERQREDATKKPGVAD